jgi:Holliday junction resolvase-like predicted endonuclease
MFDENMVCKKVCENLEKMGFTIHRNCRNTSQKGIDLILKKGEVWLCIECKGATSSKKISHNFGKKFDKKQIKNHVAKAFYQSSRVISKNNANCVTESGIALPDTIEHRNFIRQIEPVLNQLGIIVIWVCESGEIKIESPISSKCFMDAQKNKEL